MQSIIELSPNALVEQMKSYQIQRGFVTQIDGEIVVSHPIFDALKDFIVHSPDNFGHEGIFWQADFETGSLFVAAIHRTNRGAGQGGTRLKQYPTVESIFTDALRLAKGMTDKNACAGLWWGGGKSVIHPNEHPRALQGDKRVAVFANFGRFIAHLNGLYVCAEDMNTNPEDMRVIHANNRFCTCIPEEIGGSANPSTFTAYGVFKGMTASLHHIQKKKDINDVNYKGIHALVQGAGNVGWVVMEEVVKAGGRVTIFDISEATKEKIRATFSTDQVKIQEDLNAFYKTKADIFAPCAIGAILNDETIPMLKVKIIAGAANNQLKDPVKHAKLLHKKGIIYAPDFIINRMGIVNCANEQYGYLEETILEKVDEVYDFTLDLLKRAKKKNTSPQFMAMELADELSKQNHPIWSHRGKKIIQQYLKEHRLNVQHVLVEA